MRIRREQMKVRVIDEDNIKDCMIVEPQTRPEQTMKKTADYHRQYHQNHNQLYVLNIIIINFQHDDDDVDDIRSI